MCVPDLSNWKRPAKLPGRKVVRYPEVLLMADNEEQQPVIVVKKKRDHGGGHGGAWKVAYADFVTAMMAFFLVMWLVSQDQVIKYNVAGYFNDPINWGKTESGSQSILKGGESILEKSPKIPIGSPMDEQQAKEVLTQAGERIKSALSEFPDFESTKEHIEIEMTEEGLRIQLIEASSSGGDSTFFFDLGSAKLSNQGEVILSAIAKELGSLNNKIVIEGHTDSRRYVYNKIYSNWELSADRANSARRLMEEKGLRELQIDEIRGCADNRLRIKENPYDSRNRRITILVLSDLSKPAAEEKQVQGVTGEQVVEEIRSGF
jgi:chemotaxis protein MotB